MISLQRLEALVAVARLGTVTAAAAHLGYGQPTVSHHLARLEAETHCVLLRRVGRNVRLTPEGARLAERGEEILALLRRAERELEAAASLRSGVVRLVAFPSASATLVPALLEMLGARSPGLAVELLEAEPPDALRLLRQGDADVAVTFGYPGQVDGPDLSGVALMDDPLHLVTPASDRSREVAEHQDSRWIAGCERCRLELTAVCERAGFAPRIAHASDDYVAVQSLVAAGLGVTTLPGLALRAFTHPGVTVHPVEGEARRVRAVTLGRPPHPAGVEAVLRGLVEVARAG